MSFKDVKEYVEQNNNNKEKDKNKLEPAKKTNLEALKKMMERDDEHGRNSTLSENGGNDFDIAPMIDGRDVR